MIHDSDQLTKQMHISTPIPDQASDDINGSTNDNT